MIFGFNTDVKHEDTVYHVQSEARQADLLLQTQVFVRGRCIGKRATSYAEKAADANFSDQKKEQILRDQHRLVLDSIRAGHLDDMIERIPEPAVIKQLDLQWVNADSVHAEQNLIMQLRVTEGGTPVEGARLTMRFARPDAAPFYTQVYSDTSGNAEMRVEVEDSALTDSSVLVQANYSGRTATRKFQLRKVVA